MEHWVSVPEDWNLLNLGGTWPGVAPILLMQLSFRMTGYQRFNLATIRCILFAFWSRSLVTGLRQTMWRHKISVRFVGSCTMDLASLNVSINGHHSTWKTYTLGGLGKDDVAECGIMVRALEDVINNTTPSDNVEMSCLQNGVPAAILNLITDSSSDDANPESPLDDIMATFVFQIRSGDVATTSGGNKQQQRRIRCRFLIRRVAADPALFFVVGAGVSDLFLQI